MDRLPIEIIHAVFSYLEKADLAHVRLVCKCFGRVAEEHLFADFEYRLLPRQESWRRLCALAESKTIAPRLRTLCFESGVPWSVTDDYELWKGQMCYTTCALSPLTTPEHEHNRRLAEAKSRFPDLREIYENYELLLDGDAKAFSENWFVNALIEVLEKLQNVGSIRLMMRRQQIRLEDFSDSIGRTDGFHRAPSVPRQSVRERRQCCLTHFRSLVLAVDRLGGNLLSFDGDHLPLAYFRSPARNHTTLSKIWNLSLSFSDFPYEASLDRPGGFGRRQNTILMMHEGFKGVSRTLDLAKSLESLTLTVPYGVGRELEMIICGEDGQGPKLHFPRLNRLHLGNFQVTQQVLMDFLILHGPTLVHLNLSNGTLDHRLENPAGATWVHVFHAMQSSLDLESVSFGGLLKTTPTDIREIWHPRSEDDRNCCSFDATYPPQGLKHKIEHFIVHGGTCPLPDSTNDETMEKPLSVWQSLGDPSWHLKAGENEPLA